MIINKIKEEDLRYKSKMNGYVFKCKKENPKEQMDLINDTFTKRNILLHGSSFAEGYAFTNTNGEKYLFLPFLGSVHMNLDRFHLWALVASREHSGMSLSDYVNQNLGGFINTFGVRQEYYTDGTIKVNLLCVSTQIDKLQNTYTQYEGYDYYVDFFENAEQANAFMYSENGKEIQKNRLKIRQDKFKRSVVNAKP